MTKKTKRIPKTGGKKTKSVRFAGYVGSGPRKCGVCGKRGHNSRSHEDGAKSPRQVNKRSSR